MSTGVPVLVPRRSLKRKSFLAWVLPDSMRLSSVSSRVRHFCLCFGCNLDLVDTILFFGSCRCQWYEFYLQTYEIRNVRMWIDNGRIRLLQGYADLTRLKRRNYSTKPPNRRPTVHKYRHTRQARKRRALPSSLQSTVSAAGCGGQRHHLRCYY